MEDKSAGKEVEKKNKKSHEKESVSARRTVERFAGGKREEEVEKKDEVEEEDCGARYCEFVTENSSLLLFLSSLLLVPSCVTSASRRAGPSE